MQKLLTVIIVALATLTACTGRAGAGSGSVQGWDGSVELRSGAGSLDPAWSDVATISGREVTVVTTVEGKETGRQQRTLTEDELTRLEAAASRVRANTTHPEIFATTAPAHTISLGRQGEAKTSLSVNPQSSQYAAILAVYDVLAGTPSDPVASYGGVVRVPNPHGRWARAQVAGRTVILTGPSKSMAAPETAHRRLTSQDLAALATLLGEVGASAPAGKEFNDLTLTASWGMTWSISGDPGSEPGKRVAAVMDVLDGP